MAVFKIIIFTILFSGINSLENLCSDTKQANKCSCAYGTDHSPQKLPMIVANCANIQLTQFPDVNQLPQDLSYLDLSRNQINSLRINGNEKNSDSLKTLDLSYNYIGFIDENFFVDTPNLQNLILAHNNITTLPNIFHSLTKLIYLNLGFNSIQTLQDNIFGPLVQLQVLDLSYNDKALGECLSTRSLALNTNITHLNLDNIGFNNISRHYFENFINLKYVSLADNHLSMLPYVPYSVEYLDVSGSDIEEIHAKYLNYHSLKTLIMNRSKKLKTIHDYAFYNLGNLEELSITDSHILTEFNKLAFGALSKDTIWALRRLNLARNSLTTLNYTYEYLFNKLEFVDVTHNPWTCNCNLLWFKNVDNLYKEHELECSSPLPLKSKMLFFLEDDEMPDCYPEKFGKRSHRIIIPTMLLLIVLLSGLIVYLYFYYPKRFPGSRQSVGPESPYSQTRTEDI